ncbi:MAG: hypothetical protein U0165_15880 [Polyangiaceae bacterium]
MTFLPSSSVSSTSGATAPSVSPLTAADALGATLADAVAEEGVAGGFAEISTGLLLAGSGGFVAILLSPQAAELITTTNAAESCFFMRRRRGIDSRARQGRLHERDRSAPDRLRSFRT